MKNVLMIILILVCIVEGFGIKEAYLKGRAEVITIPAIDSEARAITNVTTNQQPVQQIDVTGVKMVELYELKVVIKKGDTLRFQNSKPYLVDKHFRVINPPKIPDLVKKKSVVFDEQQDQVVEKTMTINY